MSWNVCLEVNTGCVTVPVTDELVADAAIYRALLASGVDFPSLNGKAAEDCTGYLTEAMANCTGRAFRFLSDLRADCKLHPRARMSVRQ